MASSASFNTVSDATTPPVATHATRATSYDRIREILRLTKDCADVAPLLNYETFTLSGIEANSMVGVEHVMSALDADETLLMSRTSDGVFVLEPSTMTGATEGGASSATTNAPKTKGQPRSRGIQRRPNMWNSYTTYKSREIRHQGGTPPQRWGSNPDIKAEYEEWKHDPEKARALVQMSQMSKLGKLPEHHVPLCEIGTFAKSINLEKLVQECTSKDEAGAV